MFAICCDYFCVTDPLFFVKSSVNFTLHFSAFQQFILCSSSELFMSVKLHCAIFFFQMEMKKKIKIRQGSSIQWLPYTWPYVSDKLAGALSSPVLTCSSELYLHVLICLSGNLSAKTSLRLYLNNLLFAKKLISQVKLNERLIAKAQSPNC